MTLKRINRVSIGKINGSPAWDQVEKYAAADMVGGVYTDLEIASASTMEHTRPQIAITGQRGDGETPASVSGNKDAAPSLAFYVRGLDMPGGAASTIDAALALPQYDMLLEQSAGGTTRNIVGGEVVGGSTQWVLQFAAGGANGFAIGDVVGWVNLSGKMECLPVVNVNVVAHTITVAGDGATGGFSSPPLITDDIYGMRTYPIDQTAGERSHITVHGQLADTGIERLFQGCLGSVSFADADGLLMATWAAQAQTWTAQQNAAGAPVFGAFVPPNLGPVSTRGARVLVCDEASWGVTSLGGGGSAAVAVATAITGGFDMAVDIQPRAAATGVNGRQGFVAVQSGCTSDVRVYHDGTTAALLAGGSQTFGDGAALSFMDTHEYP